LKATVEFSGAPGLHYLSTDGVDDSPLKVHDIHKQYALRSEATQDIVGKFLGSSSDGDEKGIR
jgi:hypothetical protein